MRRFGTAFLIVWILGANSSLNVAASTDTCSAQNQFADRLKLEVPLASLRKGYSWIKDAPNYCAIARMGTQAEQSETARSCLIAACGRASSCASDVTTIMESLKASASVRGQYWQQQKQCKSSTAHKGPLDAYFDLMIAQTDGDPAKVRSLASGADSEVAQELMLAELDAAMAKFSRAALVDSDPTSAELGRLIVGLTTVKQAEEFLLYREVLRSPSTAIIQSGSSATVADMVLEKGQWKRDFSEEPAANSMALKQFQLLSYGIEYGAEILEDRRAISPFWVATSIQQCFQIGQFRLLVSLETATSDCRRTMEARFGAPAASKAPIAAQSGSPPTTPVQSGASAAKENDGSSNAVSDVSARVDEVFIRWARSWFTDRYVPGSAHATSFECMSSGCRAAGSFQFTRGINAVTASFDASGEKLSSGEFAVSKLCYTDDSSGASDCVQ